MIARRCSIIGCSLALVLACVLAEPGAAGARLLDKSFGIGGVAVLPEVKKTDAYASGVAARPGGGWIVAGYADFYDNGARWTIDAFRADGSQDRSFGSRGRGVQSDPGGYLSDGRSTAPIVAVQRDGKIILGGIVDVSTASDLREYENLYKEEDCSCGGFHGAFLLARYKPNGRIDRSFGRRGRVLIRRITRSWTERADESSLSQILVAPSGRIVVVGDTTYGGRGRDPHRFLAFGLRSNGAVDHKFGRAGRILRAVSGPDTNFYALKAVHDRRGSLVVAGYTESYVSGHGWQSSAALAHFREDGTLDHAFGRRGLARIRAGTGHDPVGDVDLADDGSAIFLTHPNPYGESQDENGQMGANVVALSSDGSPRPTFGTGGILDLFAAVGNDQRSGSFVNRYADGSISAITGDHGSTDSLIEASYTGADVGKTAFKLPNTRRSGVEVGSTATSGKELIVVGSVEKQNRWRQFIARFTPQE